MTTSAYTISIREIPPRAWTLSAKVVQPVWFLFRDPASIRTNRWEPISHARLESMYLDFLAEVERRFADRGEEITLITEWATSKDGERKPVKAIVTLHCLRVSGITNFAEAGVPLHVLTYQATSGTHSGTTLKTHPPPLL